MQLNHSNLPCFPTQAKVNLMNCFCFLHPFSQRSVWGSVYIHNVWTHREKTIKPDANQMDDQIIRLCWTSKAKNTENSYEISSHFTNTVKFLSLNFHQTVRHTFWASIKMVLICEVKPSKRLFGNGYIILQMIERLKWAHFFQASQQSTRNEMRGHFFYGHLKPNLAWAFICIESFCSSFHPFLPSYACDGW